MDSNSTFLGRNEFLLRRLHSLSGLIPVGAYMVVHLLTNATILNSEAAFIKNVHTIHSLGVILPVVEWVFIFLPLIFHGVFGLVIIKSAAWNNSQYNYSSNTRYSLQRISGMIAFVFIFWHVLHLHGWFHSEPMLSIARGLNGANFRPYNAASSLYLAMQGFVIPVLYFIGVLACVYHLANGIWTMGITWGVWTSPQAQRRASWVCAVFGVGLLIVGTSALVGVKNIDLKKALADEKAANEIRLKTGEISTLDVEHKTFSEAELKAAEETADELKRQNPSDNKESEMANR